MGRRDDDLQIWIGEKWDKRRREHKERRDLYNGVPLDARMQTRKRDDGRPVEKFPLKLNTAGLSCDIHADIIRGLPMDDDPLVVRTIVERKSPITSERAVGLEQIINDGVWRASSGGPEQWQAFLHMNIYGDTAFRIVWEPWDVDLPYALGVRFIRDPSYLLPVFDPQNPWRLLECYFGYLISPQVAQLKYNVKPAKENEDALYLEHWTPSEWWVHVDGQVPTMVSGDQEWPLEGENTFSGIVPFYYIPHRRTTSLFGDSQLKNQQELMEEFNARATSISDLVRDTKGNLATIRDVVTELKVKPLMVDGHVFRHVVDLGQSKMMSGSTKSPMMEPLGIPNVPDSITGWPQTLLDFWMMFNRISPAAFGTDDTKSGRITGPAVAQRMWSTVSHSTTARAHFSRVKTMIDKDILRILSLPGTREELVRARPDDEIPEVSKSDLRAQLRQQWPMMLPMDRQELLKGLVEMYKEGAISIELFLQEWGREDIEEERARNLKWAEDMAKIAAKAQPQQPQPGQEGNGQQQQQE